MVRYIALAFEDAHLELHMVREMLKTLHLARSTTRLVVFENGFFIFFVSCKTVI